MLQKLLLALTVAPLLVLGSPALGQDGAVSKGSDSLEALLRFVPNTHDARGWISYGDYDAAGAARGIEPFADSAEALSADAANRLTLWLLSIPSSGANLTLPDLTSMEHDMGIDLFTLARSIEWGAKPYTGVILAGEFDQARIDAALDARGFIETSLDDLPKWCNPDGCKKGLEQSIKDRTPGDFLGGQFGQKMPRVLDGAVLYASASDALVGDMHAASTDGNSILGDPAYRAVVQALDGDFFVRAAQFLPPEAFFNVDLPNSGEPMDEEAVAELKARMRGGESLAQFELAVFADTSGDSEAAHVLLVYFEPGLAESAAADLTSRLQTAESLWFKASWLEAVTKRGGTLEPVVVEGYPELGRWVVHLTLTKSLPSDKDASGRPESAGLLYNMLSSGYERHDIGWLWLD